MAQTLLGVPVVHGQPVNLEDGLVPGQLDDHVLVPVDAEGRQVAQLVRDNEALAAGLGTLPGKEVDLATLTVVGEGGDLDSLGVHHHHWLAVHAVSVPVDLSQGLVTRSLETFSDVDVSKIDLSVEVIDGEPFEIMDLLEGWQLEDKVLIEISGEHIGSPVLVRHNVTLVAGLVAGAGPEESILAIAVIDKVVQHQSLIINSVHISGHLAHKIFLV